MVPGQASCHGPWSGLKCSLANIVLGLALDAAFKCHHYCPWSRVNCPFFCSLGFGLRVVFGLTLHRHCPSFGLCFQSFASFLLSLAVYIEPLSILLAGTPCYPT